MSLITVSLYNAWDRNTVSGFDCPEPDPDSSSATTLYFANPVFDYSDGKAEGPFDSFDVNIPTKALALLSDRIMAAGRQLKTLDLTADGQKLMTDAWNESDETFNTFLNEHAPSGMS